MLGWARKREIGGAVLPKFPHRFSGNDPSGSRPEQGADLLASILRLPPGEAPEGRARAPR
jgi:hypothetical protein